MIALYLLVSSLCYVEVTNRKNQVNSFFATKNYNVLDALREYFHPKHQNASFPITAEEYQISLEELIKGNFTATKVVPDIGGLRLSKGKINVSSKNTTIHTMYSIANYADAVFRFLQRNRVKIIYQEGKENKVLFTSLMPKQIATWLGTSNLQAIQAVPDNVGDSFSLGHMILPNMKEKHEFVTLPLLGIQSIIPHR